MKAAVYRRYGPPDVVRIENFPTPKPKDDEVLVRVHATTVCAADWRARKTDPIFMRYFSGWLRPRKPAIGGMEFSGEVIDAGAAVKRFKVGDRIFGNPGMAGGGHAEFVIVPERSWTAPVPPNVSLDDAATLFFGGMTCLTFLPKADIKPGQRVLIYGASSAVGVAAVQIAKHLGARVTGVCGPNNLNLVQSLGADAVLDYTRDDFSKDGRIFDVIVDCVGKAQTGRVLRALKRGGVFIRIAGSLLPHPSLLIAQSTGAAKLIGPYPEMPGAEPVRQLYQLAASGALKAVIGARFAFIDIAEAHAYAESGHKVGAALVTVNKCPAREICT